MEGGLTALGIELIVDDLDRAIELFTDVLGLTLIDRGPSGLVVGEAATIDAGGIVISLLAPSAVGPGTVLAERTPRLSQIVLGDVSGGDVTPALARCAERGLAVARLGDRAFHVTPESAEGALGLPVAVVVTSVDTP